MPISGLIPQTKMPIDTFNSQLEQLMQQIARSRQNATQNRMVDETAKYHAGDLDLRRQAGAREAQKMDPMYKVKQIAAIIQGLQGLNGDNGQSVDGQPPEGDSGSMPNMPPLAPENTANPGVTAEGPGVIPEGQNPFVGRSGYRPNGQIAPGNIDLNNRPVVKNPNGKISTVLTMGIEADGKHINIPRVSDDGRILTPEEAKEQFRRTGKHLGIYSSQKAADDAAQKLHEQQAQQYGNKKPKFDLSQEIVKGSGITGHDIMRQALGLPGPKAAIQTPEEKQAMALDTNQKKLDQRSEVLTNTLKTQQQNIISNVPKVKSYIDTIIASESPFNIKGLSLSPDQLAKHNSLVTSAAETYAKAKGWPNTNDSIHAAKQILDRQMLESDASYHKRLKDIQTTLDADVEEAQKILKSPRNNESESSIQETKTLNGVKYNKINGEWHTA